MKHSRFIGDLETLFLSSDKSFEKNFFSIIRLLSIMKNLWIRILRSLPISGPHETPYKGQTDFMAEGPLVWIFFKFFFAKRCRIKFPDIVMKEFPKNSLKFEKIPKNRISKLLSYAHHRPWKYDCFMFESLQSQLLKYVFKKCLRVRMQKKMHKVRFPRGRYISYVTKELSSAHYCPWKCNIYISYHR